METVTYQIETELEFQRITFSLDEHQIPYTFKKYTDTLFPVLGQMRAYADLFIPKQYQSQFESIHNSTLNRAFKVIDDTTKAPKKVNTTKITVINAPLIVYSILTTFLALKYWYIDKENSDAKNFHYSWNSFNTELTMTSKKTGYPVNVYVDDNFDLNFERARGYSKGIKVLESYDLNEDGVFEVSVFYSLDGKQTGNQRDSDDDGLAETMELILESGDTLKLADYDEDGYFETVSTFQK